MNYAPLGAPSPAVYGEAITVVPNYQDGGLGADGLEVLPTCGIAQAIVDAKYAAGTSPERAHLRTGPVAKDEFTVGTAAAGDAAPITIGPAPLTVTASSVDSTYGTVPAITPDLRRIPVLGYARPADHPADLHDDGDRHFSSPGPFSQHTAPTRRAATSRSRSRSMAP